MRMPRKPTEPIAATMYRLIVMCATDFLFERFLHAVRGTRWPGTARKAGRRSETGTHDELEDPTIRDPGQPASHARVQVDGAEVFIDDRENCPTVLA